MNDAKAEMYGSYLALFYFACTMFLLQLYFESKLGPAVWGLVAWQIYRRNKATLIYTLTSLFWLIIVGGIIGFVWVVLDSLNLKLQQFVAAEGLAAVVSAGLFWWMRAFFEKSPSAADIFSASIARMQALASADAATVERPSPEPPAGNIRARVVESPVPEPPAGNSLTRAFDRVKQVIPRHSHPALPAVVDNPPATAGNIAETAESAPLRFAIPKQVAPLPEIKAEPSDFQKTAPPAPRSTVPPLPVVDEERFYAEVANELETGGIDKGLWTRLFAECDGDERRTKVIYIRQRVERLISAERARRSQ
jgi:hypothetical protein